MTAVEFLTACLMVTAGYAALLLSRLHDARARIRAAQLELTEAWQRADTQAHRADREAKASLAALVAQHTAESRQMAAAKYARDMEQQRDRMQQQLARATWPEGVRNV